MVVEKKDESKKKTYSLDFMLSLRSANRDRPVNMALLDFPHKRRKTDFRKQPLSEVDKFNQSVGQIRIQLNKLTQSNFDSITSQLLTKFEYTPSLLNELMKIVFMKATTETMYLDAYVRLCCILFKKFNDRENAEMNFRKLMLTRCEKQFYKLLEKEQNQRRSRRASQEA
jgi:hypothetical protein